MVSLEFFIDIVLLATL